MSPRHFPVSRIGTNPHMGNRSGCSLISTSRNCLSSSGVNRPCRAVSNGNGVAITQRIVRDRPEEMKKKLLIVLVNTDPRNPEELAAPFYHAAVAAAMDIDVDVVCAATAGKLMRKGVAEAIRVKP